MITLRFISQPQDIAAVVQLAYDPNCEIFRALWRARQRLRLALRRIYYFLASVFFSIAVLASYRFYWHINPTLPNIVIVFSFLFYYLFASLPLFVPFLIKKIFCGHKSNEAHYTDFVSKCQKICAKKLKKVYLSLVIILYLLIRTRATFWLMTTLKRKVCNLGAITYVV